jgi:cytochrome c553
MKYLVISVALLALHSGASSADSDLRAARLAASCANCHGTDGVSVDAAIPGLAGKSKAGIVAMMQQFKSGARKATVMDQLAKAYTDEQIFLIAGFFSRQAIQTEKQSEAQAGK